MNAKVKFFEQQKSKMANATNLNHFDEIRAQRAAQIQQHLIDGFNRFMRTITRLVDDGEIDGALGFVDELNAILRRAGAQEMQLNLTPQESVRFLFNNN